MRGVNDSMEEDKSMAQEREEIKGDLNSGYSAGWIVIEQARTRREISEVK